MKVSVTVNPVIIAGCQIPLLLELALFLSTDLHLVDSTEKDKGVTFKKSLNIFFKGYIIIMCELLRTPLQVLISFTYTVRFHS